MGVWLSSLCFVDLEKGLWPCSLRHSVGVLGSLLRAIRSLHKTNMSCDCIVSTKLSSFLVGWTPSGCHLSQCLLVLFVVMDRISRFNHEKKCVKFENIKLISQHFYRWCVFTDNVFLVAHRPWPSACTGTVHSSAGMRVSSSISEVISTRNRWNASSEPVVSLCPKLRSLSIWEYCLKELVGWSRRWFDILQPQLQ